MKKTIQLYVTNQNYERKARLWFDVMLIIKCLNSFTQDVLFHDFIIASAMKTMCKLSFYKTTKQHIAYSTTAYNRNGTYTAWLQSGQFIVFPWLWVKVTVKTWIIQQVEKLLAITPIIIYPCKTKTKYSNKIYSTQHICKWICKCSQCILLVT